MLVLETLRLYPPLPIITRGAVRDYVVPNTDIRIPKGCTIMIPVHAIHRDHRYYPEPEKFDPERFNDESTRDPFTFLPFGQGPRKCIAMRFGLMQARIAMCAILQEFRLLPSTSPTKRGRPIKFAIRPPIVTRDGGFWVRLQRLNP